MSKRERIAALEAKVAALEREVAALPRWSWVNPSGTYTYPPRRVGDGTSDIQPISYPLITWATGDSRGGPQ